MNQKENKLNLITTHFELSEQKKQIDKYHTGQSKLDQAKTSFREIKKKSPPKVFNYRQ